MPRSPEILPIRSFSFDSRSTWSMPRFTFQCSTQEVRRGYARAAFVEGSCSRLQLTMSPVVVVPKQATTYLWEASHLPGLPTCRTESRGELREATPVHSRRLPRCTVHGYELQVPTAPCFGASQFKLLLLRRLSLLLRAWQMDNCGEWICSFVTHRD
jgi:hypothetical protein